VNEANLTGNLWSVRRAVVDDLPALAELWRAAQLPAVNFEKNFTDFQVAEGTDGKLHGAIAMQIAGGSGRIYSEAIADFSLADTLRPMIWARLRSVAQNHGLIRVWTLETAPFWKKDAGFAAPPAEAREKFPEAFGSLTPDWLMLKLRDEMADVDSIERQFAAFKETERAKRERLLGQVKPLKWIALGLAMAIFVIAVVGLVMAAKTRSGH